MIPSPSANWQKDVTVQVDDVGVEYWPINFSTPVDICPPPTILTNNINFGVRLELVTFQDESL